MIAGKNNTVEFVWQYANTNETRREAILIAYQRLLAKASKRADRLVVILAGRAFGLSSEQFLMPSDGFVSTTNLQLSRGGLLSLAGLKAAACEANVAGLSQMWRP